MQEAHAESMIENVSTSEGLRLRTGVDDAERLAVLRLYDILDSAIDPEYEKLAQMLRLGCRAKWSTITFVDRDRQWFKATDGCAMKQTPRSVSFCSVSMQQSEPLIVEDARLDPRFRDGATVIGEPFVRFYAGFPIISREGYGLGSVCVNDTEPRSLTERELKLIEQGRNWVQAKLELRRHALSSNKGETKQPVGAYDRLWHQKQAQLAKLWEEIEGCLRHLQRGSIGCGGRLNA